MVPGTHVRLEADGGEQIQRRLVRVDGDVLEVCRDEEWEAAEREGRSPITVGFKRIWLVTAEAASPR